MRTHGGARGRGKSTGFGEFHRPDSAEYEREWPNVESLALGEQNHQNLAMPADPPLRGRASARRKNRGETHLVCNLDKEAMAGAPRRMVTLAAVGRVPA